MKKTLAIAVLVLCSVALGAQNLPDVTLPSLPSTVEEFISLRNQIATTPQGGAAMFVVALKMYADNPVEGTKALIVAIDSSQLSASQGANSYQGYAMRQGDFSLLSRQIDQAKYIPNSYFSSATPANGYQVTAPLTIRCSINRYSGEEARGDLKVFVATSGAGTPRPLRLVKASNGYWKAREWSSLIVGVMRPSGGSAPAAGPEL